MTKISWKELFPTTLSFIVFVLYIVLFVNHGILVTASQSLNNKYEYNVVTVVLLTEVLKLFASVILYCKDENITSLGKDVIANKRVLGLYLVPAFLYCLYNNLSFHNLSTFDPTTYNLMLQFRVAITAILFQIIFKKKLTKKQWLSLLILTIGCMLKQFNFSSEIVPENKSAYKKFDGLDFFNISTVFIFVQLICSCLAGVYNEYLLKNAGANVNIFVQNVFMYLDSILCNSIILLIQGNLLEAFTYNSLSKVLNFKVLIVMINNAAVGIITSFFLKTLNSILKTFASALELVLTAILCYLLFSIPIYLNTVLSIGTVLFAVYLYSQNPVQNPIKLHHAKSEESQELIMDEVLVKT